MAFGQFQPGQVSSSPVATGQSYAQSIAGGMPMEQVIAPGASYSPEQPGGYTQESLNLAARDARIAELKKNLVWQDAPGTGEKLVMEDQMPYAPPGMKQPTPWIPGQTPFPTLGNFDFLKGLDFSNLPDFSNIDVDTILKDYQDRQDIGEPEPITSFFESPAPVMPSAPVSSGLFDITPELIAKQIEKQKLEGIEPIYDRVAEEQIIPSFIPQPVINQVPVMPEMPVYQEPVYQEPVYQEPVYQIPNFPIQQPMNFTGLPNIPMMPTAPVYIPPQAQVPAYVQPRVEDIISPIRSGSTRRPQANRFFPGPIDLL